MANADPDRKGVRIYNQLGLALVTPCIRYVYMCVYMYSSTTLRIF